MTTNVFFLFCVLLMLYFRRPGETSLPHYAIQGGNLLRELAASSDIRSMEN